MYTKWNRLADRKAIEKWAKDAGKTKTERKAFIEGAVQYMLDNGVWAMDPDVWDAEWVHEKAWEAGMESMYDVSMEELKKELEQLIEDAYEEWEDGWDWTMEVGVDGNGRMIYASGVSELGSAKSFAKEHDIPVDEAKDIIDSWKEYDDDVKEISKRARDEALDVLYKGARLSRLEGTIHTLRDFGDAGLFETVLERLEDLPA